MKIVATIIILSLFLIGIASAITNPTVTTEIKESTIESIIIGLNSDNLGLKNSSAYMAGELRISNALIPLLRILHNDNNEELRITAALALYKIGSPIAINAVKQAIRFDESERVSKLCANFYNDYHRNKIKDEEINVDVLKTALK